MTLRERTLALNPPLEVIRLEANAYFGFELHEAGHLKKMGYKLSPTSNYDTLKLEISSNGTNWTVVPFEEKKEILQATTNQVVKYIRIRNVSSETVEVKIEQFTVDVK